MTSLAVYLVYAAGYESIDLVAGYLNREAAEEHVQFLTGRLDPEADSNYFIEEAEFKEIFTPC